eukprot:1297614-Lingulodinium_polyedra.AAC.1
MASAENTNGPVMSSPCATPTRSMSSFAILAPGIVARVKKLLSPGPPVETDEPLVLPRKGPTS